MRKPLRATPRLILALILTVFGVSLVLPTPEASAASYCSTSGMGRGGCIGFFNGGNATPTYCHDGGSDVINVLPKGLHANSANQMINIVKGNLGKSGSGRNQKGAAFIVHAVLGQHKTGKYNPTVQWARNNFARFESKVRAYAKNKDGYGIRWNVSRTTGRNSAYFNNCAHDDAFHTTIYGGATAAVIEFYAPGGKKLQIERACANLRGDVKLPNPPSATWRITPTTGNPSYTKPAEAGVKVTWKHHVKNAGPDKTDDAVKPRIITQRIKNGTTKEIANVGKANIAKDWKKGVKHDYGGSYTLTHADEGAKICQYITATPGSDKGGTAKSSRTCLKVPAVVLACKKTDRATGNEFWNLKVLISTEQEEVRVGNTMTWKHELQNLGPDTTDLPISWGYSGNASGGNWTANNIGNNGIRNKTTTHVATQDDVGTYYKRATWADPGGRGWSAWTSWTDVSPRDISGTKSDTPKDKNNHEYRRVFDHYGYKGDVQTRSKKKKKDGGGYTAWKKSGSWGWSSTNEAGKISDTKRKTLTDTRSRYRLQERTRHKQKAGKIETGNCGIYVPYDYKLKPTIDTVGSHGGEEGDQAAMESGTSFNVNGTISNQGPTKSESVNWKITRLIYPKGVSYPTKAGVTVGDSDACVVFDPDGDTDECTVKTSGSAGVIAAYASKPVTATDTTPNIDAGSHVCYVLSINPWRNTVSSDGGHPGDGPSTWEHSMVKCMVVARKPKLHIIDGDLKTRGEAIASKSVVQGKTYGSWVDYGVFSTGQNSVIASGGGLRGGNNSASSGSWSKLTFANTPSLGGFGLGVQTSLFDYFKSRTSTASESGSISLSGGDKVIKATSDLTITSSVIPVGSTVIVQAPGKTVTISDNIRYKTGNSIDSMGKIPQVVIVAENINIVSDVERVDAWLIATGSINTCSDSTGDLTVDDCQESLAINGPVLADSIHFRRTAGATADNPGEAAETIRLTPWTYLWLYEYAEQADQLNTVYSTERPPRF